jgi:hypothetical protein
MAVTVGTLLFASHPRLASAQSPEPRFQAGVDYGLGGSRTNNVSGFTVSVGPFVRIGPVFAVVNPVEATFSSEYGYTSETYDGIAICETVDTGRTVDDSYCDTDGQNVPTVAAALILPKEIFDETHLFVGGGRRFDRESPSWFGTVGVNWYKAVIRTNFGPGYFLITLGGSIPIPGLTH